MAILLRSLNDVTLYTRELREAGIDYVIDGGKAFAERPEVVEALALLEALANPADPVAALAVLRSAFGGAGDGELAAYARDGGRFYWPAALAEDLAAKHTVSPPRSPGSPTSTAPPDTSRWTGACRRS